MPPRKSINDSILSNGGAEDGAEGTSTKQAKDGMSVEDLSLPKSMIARLAKGVLPANTQIHKDALLALHKSATVFVSYIASNSNEIAQSAGKKTVLPQDVAAAMKDCELEDFLPRLEAELKKYNEMQCDKRNTYRRKVKEEKAAVASTSGGPTKEGGEGSAEGDSTIEIIEAAAGANGAPAVNGHADQGDDVDRPAKKLKGEDGSAMVAGDADEEMGDVRDEGDEQLDEADDDDDDDVADDEDEDGDEDEDEDDDEADNDDDDDDDAAAARPTLGGDPRPSEMRDEALDDPGSDSD